MSTPSPLTTTSWTTGFLYTVVAILIVFERTTNKSDAFVIASPAQPSSFRQQSSPFVRNAVDSAVEQGGDSQQSTVISTDHDDETRDVADDSSSWLVDNMETDDSLDEHFEDDDESGVRICQSPDQVLAGNDLNEIQDFLQKMEDVPVGRLSLENSIRLNKSLTAAIHLDADADPVVRADAAERLLHRMLEEWQASMDNTAESSSKEKVSWLEPSAQNFLDVMRAWEAALTVVDSDESTRSKKNPTSKANNNHQINTNVLPTVVEHVWMLHLDQQNLLNRHADKLSKATESQVVVDSLQTVLKVMSSSRERGMSRRVWSIWEEVRTDDFQAKHDDESSAVVDLCETVIFCLAKSRSDNRAAHRAEQVLRLVAEKYPPRLLDNGNPAGLSIDSFNVVITAWAKSGFPYAGERAEKLIVFMDELDSQHDSPGLVKPNAASFTSLIDAYARQEPGDWDTCNQAERILNRLLDHYLTEQADPESNNNNSSNNLEPNVATWTIVISAFARLAKKGFRGAAGRADKLLKRMESLHDEGRISFGPDAIVYMKVMNAHAFSKSKQGPEFAEEILNEMNGRYLDGDDTMKPSAKSIRVVLDSWVRARRMEEAEFLLDRYTDLLDSMGPPEDPPEVLDDVKSIYKNLLVGWCKAGDPARAQDYLLDMTENDMQPDCFCYEKIVEANTALGDDGAMSRSQQVFDLMTEQQTLGKVEPNERLYTSFIRAMVKAKVDSMAEKAHETLESMRSLHDAGNKEIRPTIYTYNAVLLACAETGSLIEDSARRFEAFKLAVKVFNELRKDSEVEPDYVSYGNMLRCSMLLTDENEQKDALIRMVFATCCKAGFVNDLVVRDLRQAASEGVWRELLNCHSDDVIEAQSLPAVWRRRFDTPPKERQFDARRQSNRFDSPRKMGRRFDASQKRRSFNKGNR